MNQNDRGKMGSGEMCTCGHRKGWHETLENECGVVGCECREFMRAGNDGDTKPQSLASREQEARPAPPGERPAVSLQEAEDAELVGAKGGEVEGERSAMRREEREEQQRQEQLSNEEAGAKGGQAPAAQTDHVPSPAVREDQSARGSATPRENKAPETDDATPHPRNTLALENTEEDEKFRRMLEEKASAAGVHPDEILCECGHNYRGHSHAGGATNCNVNDCRCQAFKSTEDMMAADLRVRETDSEDLQVHEEERKKEGLAAQADFAHNPKVPGPPGEKRYE